MGNELLNFQRLSLGRLAQEEDGFLWTVSNAHPAAHARCLVYVRESITHRNRRELANVGALAAASTQPLIHHRHVPRRRDHRRPVAVGIHGPTAARAAVADGVETTEHRILVVWGTINKRRSL